MSEHEFTLAIAGDPNTDENLEALFEAGCDDATFGSIDGAAYGSFTRQAPSFETAVRNAISQVQSVAGLRVVRIEPEDLVSATEIAERMTLTRQVVSLFISGARRTEHGPFPLPASHLTSRQRLWRWSEVLAWDKGPQAPEVQLALWIAGFNDQLANLWRRASQNVFISHHYSLRGESQRTIERLSVHEPVRIYTVHGLDSEQITVTSNTASVSRLTRFAALLEARRLTPSRAFAVPLSGLLAGEFNYDEVTESPSQPTLDHTAPPVVAA